MTKRHASNAELMRTWRRLLEINTTEAGKRLEMSSRSIEGIEQGRPFRYEKILRLALESA